jgi:hypothetical protein
MTLRRLLLSSTIALVALMSTGCLDLDAAKKVDPLPIPADQVLAVKPCDEDAASRVLEFYKLMTRSSGAVAARTTTAVRTDRWGTVVDCTVPIVKPGDKTQASDQVGFSIASSTEFKDWWTKEYLPTIGAVYQTEFGTKPGEELLIAVKGTDPVEVVWVANDGLFMTVRADSYTMSVSEQRAMLLSVANEIHETYKAVAGVK